MGDRKDLHSPLRRARLGLLAWLDVLPQELRADAEMSLDRLCEAAEREIEQAYFDGSNHRNTGAILRERRTAPVTSHKQETP